MKVSDNTSVSMPMRNLLSILGATAVGVWAYFGVIERLNNNYSGSDIDSVARMAKHYPLDELIMAKEFHINDDG